MDFLQTFLTDKGAAMADGLMDKLGFTQDQASGFVVKTVKSTLGALSSGKVDFASLLGEGGIKNLVGQLDLGALSRETGVDADQAAAGVAEVAPPLLDSLKGAADDPEKLLAMIGGDGGGILDKVSKMAGGFFKN